MIRRAEEMVREVRSQMRGGSGEVQIIHLFKAGEYKGKARLYARIILEPGCSIGLHEHVGEEEIYVVIRGQAVLSDSTLEQEQVMGPGDASLDNRVGSKASLWLSGVKACATLSIPRFMPEPTDSANAEKPVLGAGCMSMFPCAATTSGNTAPDISTTRAAKAIRAFST